MNIIFFKLTVFQYTKAKCYFFLIRTVGLFSNTSRFSNIVFYYYINNRDCKGLLRTFLTIQKTKKIMFLYECLLWLCLTCVIPLSVCLFLLRQAHGII